GWRGASPRQGGHHQVAPRLGARISGAAGDLSHARGDVTERLCVGGATSNSRDEVRYFTLIYRPAGQLSLMQASGLWLCSGQAWTFCNTSMADMQPSLRTTFWRCRSMALTLFDSLRAIALLESPSCICSSVHRSNSLSLAMSSWMARQRRRLRVRCVSSKQKRSSALRNALSSTGFSNTVDAPISMAATAVWTSAYALIRIAGIELVFLMIRRTSRPESKGRR